MIKQCENPLSQSESDLISVYRELLRIRRVEERFSKKYAEQEIRCPMHLSIGQEAISVGISKYLTNEDHVYSGHRSHSHYLAKGGNLGRMVAEAYGKLTGCCGGRGGSQHLIDLEVGFMGSTPIVGGTVPLAVGDAWAAKLKSNGCVTVVYFGDGCFEEGVMHESMNFALLHELPIVFVCENNGYSVYTKLADRQPPRKMSDVASAHGMNTYNGDGNNVLDISEMASDAINRARSGEGPQFLELQTYRWLEHCGPNDDDDLRYRPVGELSHWKDRCPIELLKVKMFDEKIITEHLVKNIEDEISKEIDDAYEFTLNSPNPKSSQMGEYTYA
jgi:pyruvate dehydrogenase E1 component alpha subunit